MGRIGYLVGVGLGSLVTSAAGQAAAQEYCVACSEPTGLYRCVIDGAQPRGGQSLQMLCVTAMAKDGGHATCSVKRGTVFECDGAVKRIPWAALEVGPQPEAAEPLGHPAAAQARAGRRAEPCAGGSASDHGGPCQAGQREDGRAGEEGGQS